jgi:hypothetical protein
MWQSMPKIYYTQDPKREAKRIGANIPSILRKSDPKKPTLVVRERVTFVDSWGHQMICFEVEIFPPRDMQQPHPE